MLCAFVEQRGKHIVAYPLCDPILLCAVIWCPDIVGNINMAFLVRKLGAGDVVLASVVFFKIKAATTFPFDE